MFQRGLVEQCSLNEVRVVNGQPILNGCFGVHRRWETAQDGTRRRVLRFISNLVPCNSVLLPVCGAAQQLGNPGLWSQILLGPDQELVLYSEDQASCFNLFRAPPCWRAFFTFACSASAVGSQGPPVYVRLTVIPMGWTLAVDVVQEAHMTLLAHASSIAPALGEERLMQLHKLFPTPFGPHGTHYHSCCIDNWDALVAVSKEVAHQLLSKPSAEQLALRQVYDRYGVQRAPDKALEGSSSFTSLGCVDGKRGSVAAPLQRRVQLMTMASWFVWDAELSWASRQTGSAGFGVPFRGWVPRLVSDLAGGRG
eukprot:3588295-Amphidinium_carterae.1